MDESYAYALEEVCGRVFIDLPLNGLIGMMAISVIGYSIAPMSYEVFVSNLNIALDIIFQECG